MSRKSARALSTNFTEGPILRQLASFALPVLREAAAPKA